MLQPPTADRPYIFVSYASADRERVLEIVAALREAGIRCWLDQHDIAGGSNWGGSIADAIEGCAALVLLASAASLSSRNVRQEIALAWQHDKPSVPLLLDTTPIPNDIAYWLATAQWIEVLGHPDERWLPKVTSALARLIDQRDNVEAPSTSSVAPSLYATTYLPSPPSSFVGREREVAEVAALLHTERIVTLVGTGGIGKTRVAIAAGHRLTGAYADGVVFVDLAPLDDPALVLPTIAASAGVRESGEVSLFDALVMALRPRRLLLILDNVEQVIEAASEVSRLISGCPSLSVLATSREPLRISGEADYPLTPLPLPGLERGIDIDRLRANPTVALFVQRARSGTSGFDLTPENAEAIIAICQRLDGLPLAIELAAARIRMMPPRALAERLREPFGVLTGGARDLPERQRTMSGAIRWSYDLLTPDEQRLMCRLSVLVGGWTLDSAEAVVNAADEPGLDLLDGLASLADKSLVVQREQQDGELRFSMLGMIREFASQQLEQSDDRERVYKRLAAAMERLAISLRDALATSNESAVVARIDTERDNLRAALDWSLRRGDVSDAEATRGLGTAANCWSYWDTSGHLAEGLRWLEAFLAFGERLPVERRIDAQTFAGMLARNLGAYDIAEAHLASVVTLARQIERPELGAIAMNFQARHLLYLKQLDDAEALATKSVAYLRGANDRFGIGLTLGTLAQIAMEQDDLLKARALSAEWTQFLRQQGDFISLTGALGLGARLAHMVGDLVEAEALAIEAARLGGEQDYAAMAGWGTMLLSRIAVDAGDLQRAQQQVVEGLALVTRSGYTAMVGSALVDAAFVADAVGLQALALQLCAVAETVPDITANTFGVDLDSLQRLRARLRAALDDAAMLAAEDAARRMSLDDAVAAVVAAFTASSAS